jgi:hypothetical protein
MPTKKKILLQQASMMRESKKAKGILKSKPRIIRKKVARKATPPQAPSYKKAPPKTNMKAPPTKKLSAATRSSAVRRSVRVRKPK